MAKDSEDREDLLRDATGYIERMEFKIPNVQEEVFVGFRECGALSIYWGQDDVVQFNAKHELRRAYTKDQMVACYRAKLHWLEKAESEAGNATIKRIMMEDQDAERFMLSWGERMSLLSTALKKNGHSIIGQVPSTVDVTARLTGWLSDRNGEIKLALHPGLGKK